MLLSACLVVPAVSAIYTAESEEGYWDEREANEAGNPLLTAVVQETPWGYSIPNTCGRAWAWATYEWIPGGFHPTLTVPAGKMVISRDPLTVGTLVVDGALLAVDGVHVVSRTKVGFNGVVATADGRTAMTDTTNAGPTGADYIGAGSIVLEGIHEIAGTLVAGSGSPPDAAPMSSSSGTKNYIGSPGTNAGTVAILSSEAVPFGLNGACVGTGDGSDGGDIEQALVTFSMGNTVVQGGDGGRGGDILIAMHGKPWAVTAFGSVLCPGDGGKGQDVNVPFVGHGSLELAAGGGGRSGWIFATDDLSVTYNDVQPNHLAGCGIGAPAGNSDGHPFHDEEIVEDLTWYMSKTTGRMPKSVQDLVDWLNEQLELQPQPASSTSSSNCYPSTVPDPETDPDGWALYWFAVALCALQQPPPNGPFYGAPGSPSTEAPSSCTGPGYSPPKAASSTGHGNPSYWSEYMDPDVFLYRWYHHDATDAVGGGTKGEGGFDPSPVVAIAQDGGAGLVAGGKGGDAKATNCDGGPGQTGGDGAKGGDAPSEVRNDCEISIFQAEESGWSETVIEETLGYSTQFRAQLTAIVEPQIDTYESGKGAPASAAEVFPMLEDGVAALEVTAESTSAGSVQVKHQILEGKAYAVTFQIKVGHCSDATEYRAMAGDGSANGGGGKGGDGGDAFAQGGNGGPGIVVGGGPGSAQAYAGNGAKGGNSGVNGAGGSGCNDLAPKFSSKGGANGGKNPPGTAGAKGTPEAWNGAPGPSLGGSTGMFPVPSNSGSGSPGVTNQPVNGVAGQDETLNTTHGQCVGAEGVIRVMNYPE